MKKTIIYSAGILATLFISSIVIGKITLNTTHALHVANVKALTTSENQADQGNCGDIYVWQCYYECKCGALYEAPQLYPGPMTEIKGYCNNCGRELKK